MNDTTGRWFIILTEPQREITAAANLYARHFAAFAPSIKKRVPTGRKDQSGKKEMREREYAMFPGYIFVCFQGGAERFEAARKVVGVREFLKIEGVPATIPGVLINAIRGEESRQLSKYEYSNSPKAKLAIPFVEGGPARIEGGPYDDWVGKMLKLSKSGRVRMLVAAFGGNVEIEIDGSQVRAA